MKVLSTYSNMGEAGFVQSMLQSEGIDVFVTDPRNILGGVQAVSLEVADEDLERARELITRMSPAAAEQAAPAPEDPHPTQGYPFAGIISAFAVLGLVLSIVGYFFSSPHAAGIGLRLGWLVFFIVTGTCSGFVAGVVVSLLALPVYWLVKRSAKR